MRPRSEEEQGDTIAAMIRIWLQLRSASTKMTFNRSVRLSVRSAVVGSGIVSNGVPAKPARRRRRDRRPPTDRLDPVDVTDTTNAAAITARNNSASHNRGRGDRGRHQPHRGVEEDQDRQQEQRQGAGRPMHPQRQGSTSSSARPSRGSSPRRKRSAPGLRRTRWPRTGDPPAPGDWAAEDATGNSDGHRHGRRDAPGAHRARCARPASRRTAATGSTRTSSARTNHSVRVGLPVDVDRVFAGDGDDERGVGHEHRERRRTRAPTVAITVGPGRPA